MGSGCQSFGVAWQHLAQAVGLFGHYRRHRVLADRRLKLFADPIVHSDYFGCRSRHFDANLVHLAWTETAQSWLMAALAGYVDYAAKVRYRLIPGVW